VERHLPKVFEGLFESGGGKQYMSTLGAVAPYLVEETPEHGRKETWLDSGVNPPKGAVITYYLREKPESTISLRIEDAEGKEVKTFKSLHADKEEKADRDNNGRADAANDETPKELRIPSKAGWNRFVWDLRYPDARKVIPHGDNQQGFIKGPHAAPGSYRATLCVGDDFVHLGDFPSAPRSGRGQQAFAEDLLVKNVSPVEAITAQEHFLPAGLGMSSPVQGKDAAALVRCPPRRFPEPLVDRDDVSRG